MLSASVAIFSFSEMNVKFAKYTFILIQILQI